MSQRAALTEGEKQYLRERKAAGASLGQIAQELDCSWETTRKWWRVHQKSCQPGPRGRPRRGAVSSYPTALQEKLVAVKQAHPHWGPTSIKLELHHDPEWTKEHLPSNARLSALFRERCPEAVQPRQQRITRPAQITVSAPHQRWQMDAKEQVCIGQESVTIQEIRDIYTGLMLGAVAFVTTTEKWYRHLTLAENQQVLRLAFQQWGLPREVQTDHDDVFVLHTDPTFPSLFTLWLVGLGIQHVTSRPRRPTDQGAVERNHRTLADFSWKDQSFTHLSDLQQALDLHQQRYNEEFPAQAAHCAGSPPLVAFPAARTTGRPYHPAEEWDRFDMSRVDDYLSQRVWTRPVMDNGIVNLGGKHYYVGNHYHHQQVAIRFQSDARHFAFFTEQGLLLKSLPALGLAKEDIIGFLSADLHLPVGYQFSLPLCGV